MPEISSFELTKPILLFDAVWKESDLIRLPTDNDEEQFGDVTSMSIMQDLFGGILSGHQPSDLWGIDWSPVPDAAWNEIIPPNIERIGRYSNAYLRFIITVLNGRAGDSMLFLYNQGSSHNSGLHAAVHVEIGMEPVNDTGVLAQFNDRSVRRSTAVEQLFTQGWSISHLEDENRAFNFMKGSTDVRFLGLAKQPDIEIHAKCILLGGMF